MNRRVRIYKSPEAESPGTIIGFSLSISDANTDPLIHTWLRERGYGSVALESEVAPLEAEQFFGTVVNVVADIASTAFMSENGAKVKLPPESHSCSHILVRPPLDNDEDLRQLGMHLASLDSCHPGNNNGYLIDNRCKTPQEELDTGRYYHVHEW